LSYFRDISTFGGCTAGPTAAIENMKIIEEEDLCGNSVRTGAYLHERLHELMDKHKVIGDVRGKGLFAGAELVTDRATREPVSEKLVAAVTGDCLAQGVIVGATNRSVPGYNNTLLFAPALIATRDDIDVITGAVDKALTKVFG
jgi:taurine-pyruvate aminotransferase